jgi:hypothetical protein
MTGLEFQVAFQRELNQLDEAPEFNTRDIVYWLNYGILRFVKTRYSGVNAKRESVGQTQKRIDDLRTLLVEEAITPSVASVTNFPDAYEAEIPSNYMFTLSEEVDITFTDLTLNEYTKRVGVKEVNTGNYVKEYSDPYSEYHIHHNTANPLRLFIGGTGSPVSDLVVFITDGNYTVDTYYLVYLKFPTLLVLNNNSDIASWQTTQYTDLPKHTHSEIVKLAVASALENTGNPRYEAYINEVNTME